MMTMTVKLAPALEQGLRQRSVALGKPASELIRDALQIYLDSTPAPARSAFELGQGLFGQHAGPADLAAARKMAFAKLVAEKQDVERVPREKTRRGGIRG
jgi:hypothetical protein